MRHALTKHGASQKSEFIAQLEQDILSNLNASFDVGEGEDNNEEEVKQAVRDAQAAAAEKAKAVRQKHNEKVASLCDRIAQLKRELTVRKMKCRINSDGVALTGISGIEDSL